MLSLKMYQESVLDKLRSYLEQVRALDDPASPFVQLREAQGYVPEYRPLDGLNNIPYVCLRLPTGGGKTLLSAHSVALAAAVYLEMEFPIVLWLVPTDAIRKQTLETLKNPRHPNRAILDDKFGGRVRVFDIGEFRLLRPQDVGQTTCVFVATFGAFRVNSTDGRHVYAHTEDLEPHFSHIPPSDWLEKDEQGRVKFSFANLLASYRPLVIVDEAHNHTTDLSAQVLKRVRAAAVIEFTATPAADSNVLYKVSASELKAEDMIKLPVRLSEHLSWADAVTAALQTRAHLEQVAGGEDEYLRPIVLFQAQDKNEEVTVDVLVKHLVDQENIPRQAIAVATGSQRELDKVNLLDRGCKVRYVVTVEALKEGWDCSFAYVFCSMARVRSGKDAEQLLGRILRMPYARRRRQDDLNRAYAHIPVAAWTEGLARVRDHLVSMGFEEKEAEANIQLELTFGGAQTPSVSQREIVVYSPEKPDTSMLDFTIQAETKVEQVTDGRFKVTFSVASRSDARELMDNARRVFQSEQAQTALVQQLSAAGTDCRPLTPSERGERFVVPQLCLDFGSTGNRPAEKEDFLPQGIDLLQFPVALDAFHVVHEEHVYEIDVFGAKVMERALQVQDSLNLPNAVTHWTEANLVSWLNRRLEQPDIPYTQMVEFLRRHIRFLVEHKAILLAELVRLRVLLEKTLRERIKDLRSKSYGTAIQQVILGAPNMAQVVPEVAMVFREGAYPVRSFYTGSFQFTRHFFPSIADMDGEEIQCAMAIDRHPKVKTWVRNLDRQPTMAFWLPTHEDKFYPDFVVQLEDGRILLVEYKGKPYETNDDSKEKALIGELWANRSHGKGLFLMAVKRDGAGRDVWGQLCAAIDA